MEVVTMNGWMLLVVGFRRKLQNVLFFVFPFFPFLSFSSFVLSLFVLFLFLCAFSFVFYIYISKALVLVGFFIDAFMESFFEL